MLSHAPVAALLSSRALDSESGAQVSPPSFDGPIDKVQVLPPGRDHDGISIPVEDEDNSLAAPVSVVTHLFLDDVMRNKWLFPLEDRHELWPTPEHGWAAMMIGGTSDPCSDDIEGEDDVSYRDPISNLSESSCNALPRATTTWGDACGLCQKREPTRIARQEVRLTETSFARDDPSLPRATWPGHGRGG